LEVEDLSELTGRDSSQVPQTTLSESAIGCVYRNDAAFDAAATQLLTFGIAADALHVGSSDAQRAQAAAQRHGIRADVHADDPLADIVTLDRDDTARAAVDRWGIIGALIGACSGVALSFTPAGALIHVPHPALQLANVGFYFVVGAIVGSVLGAALGPQASTHAGFRLIDGMQEGAYALIVVAPHSRHDELQKILEAAGGTGMTRV
jgi:hypothetical protein